MFVSCNKDNYENDGSIRKFNYKTFESYKNIVIRTEIPSTVSGISDNEMKHQKILNIVNDNMGSTMSLNSLDYKYLNNLKNNEDEYLNSKDIDLLNKFEADLLESNFQIALNNFEKNVLKLNLNDSEFGKYNTFINIILLIENAEPEIFKNKNLYSKRADSCGEAIAAYSLATIGLAACSFPGYVKSLSRGRTRA